jgi:hypothetical protein
MNWIKIKLKDDTTVFTKACNVTPSGVRMFNTSSGQLVKILNGDGRNIHVCRNYNTILFIIKSEDIADFAINGVSVKEIEEKKEEIHYGCPWLHSLER